MAPGVGLEPTTNRLTADCSTIELPWSGVKYLYQPFGCTRLKIACLIGSRSEIVYS